jgi:hypothetical protein
MRALLVSILAITILGFFSCDTEEGITEPAQEPETITSINGLLTDSYGNILIGTEVIALRPSEGEPVNTERIGSTKTDSNGLYTIALPAIPTDSLYLLAMLPVGDPQFTILSEQTDLPPIIDEKITLDIYAELEPRCAIQIELELEFENVSDSSGDLYILFNEQQLMLRPQANEGKLLVGLCPGEYDLLYVSTVDSLVTDISVSSDMPQNEPMAVKVDLDKNSSCCDNVLIVDYSDGYDPIPYRPLLYKMIDLTTGKQMPLTAWGKTPRSQLSHFCDGDYQLIISSEGRLTIDTTVRINCGPPTEIYITLRDTTYECESSFWFVVYEKYVDPNSSENIMIDAYIKLYQDSELISEVKCNNGSYQYEHICPGVYDVEITAGGYEPMSFELDLEKVNHEIYSYKMKKIK